MTKGKEAAVVIAMAPLYILSMSWAVSVHWSWWLAPMGAPSITLAHAYGLWLLIALATFKNKEAQDLPKKPIEKMAKYVFAPVISVGIGWLVHAAKVAGW